MLCLLWVHACHWLRLQYGALPGARCASFTFGACLTFDAYVFGIRSMPAGTILDHMGSIVEDLGPPRGRLGAMLEPMAGIHFERNF